ncbi:MAG: hypothetical protein HXY26_11910 [Hydrogenophilaceae bacterium]|nr:hypothetical protein [Hydrogenophilaceae bacterium]
MTDQSPAIATGASPPPTGARTPGGVRALVWGVLGALGGGALYLLVVRGEALLLDLAALGRLVLCL